MTDTQTYGARYSGPWRDALLTIDGETSFPGQVCPSTWNGWECPRFTREGAESVARWMAEGDGEWHWHGDVLHVREGDWAEWEAYGPDFDGRYQVGAGGWTWYETAEEYPLPDSDLIPTLPCDECGAPSGRLCADYCDTDESTRYGDVPTAPAHVDYPHAPGYLTDCPGCEGGPCVCADDATLAPCVSAECERRGEEW